MKKLFALRQGFTLTEMMIVVSLFGIVSAVGASIFSQVTRNFNMNKARVSIQRDARTVLDLINRNLRQASAATVSIDQITGQPPQSRMTFYGTDGNFWSFYQEGKQLKAVHNSSTSTLCENLRYLAFTYPTISDVNLVSVSITTEQETYELQSKTLQLSVEKVRIMND